MKKVYLVYYHGNYDDGSGYGNHEYKNIEKAFQTRHEAEEYVDSKKYSYRYSVESVKIESKKKKVLTNFNIDDKIIE